MTYWWQTVLCGTKIGVCRASLFHQDDLDDVPASLWPVHSETDIAILLLQYCHKLTDRTVLWHCTSQLNIYIDVLYRMHCVIQTTSLATRYWPYVLFFNSGTFSFQFPHKRTLVTVYIMLRPLPSTQIVYTTAAAARHWIAYNALICC